MECQGQEWTKIPFKPTTSKSFNKNPVVPPLSYTEINTKSKAETSLYNLIYNRRILISDGNVLKVISIKVIVLSAVLR